MIGIEAGKDKTLLHTGISERAFAQSKMLQHLKEKGYRVLIDAEHINFNEWVFTDTAQNTEETMMILGAGFEGDSLFDILHKKSDISWKILKKLTLIIAEAERKGINLPLCSPETIFIVHHKSEYNEPKYNESEYNYNEFIFLPSTIFCAALKNQSDKTYSEKAGFYLNESLNMQQKPAFFVASLMYTFLCGIQPYSNTNTELRTEDFFDSNYVGIENYIETNADFIQNINGALTKNKSVFIHSILKSLPNELPKQKTLIEKSQLTQKYSKSLQKKIKTVRFFRKYRAALIAGFISIMLLTGGIVSYVQNQAQKPTTKGLSSLQTVQMFYNALNTLDLDQMTACVKKGAAKELLNYAMNVYVTFKVRQAYEGFFATYPPQKWFDLPEENRKKYLLFGIDKLVINQQTENLFTVRYTLYISEGENYSQKEHIDTLTLKKIKNNWVIVDFSN